MFGFSTSCPKCKHEFNCCPLITSSSCLTTSTITKNSLLSKRRTSRCLSGGGLITKTEEQTSSSTTNSPCQSPQISPSMPLAFLMPPSICSIIIPTPTPPPPTSSSQEIISGLILPETDLESLSDTVRVLRQSGWFYEGLGFEEAHELLKNSKVGTFLIRNSADPSFLFALSVQTERGPTSVRIHYQEGYFRLDAQTHLQPAMPIFDNVVELVEHYVNQSKLCQNGSQVWVDPMGQLYSPIVLDKPLIKNFQPHSLKHLSRMIINKSLKLSNLPKVALLTSPHAQLELPKSLKLYLEDYPYTL